MVRDKIETSKFRTQGLKFVDQLDILFKDVAATGEGAWALFSGYVPNHVDDGSSRERVNDFDITDGLDVNFTDDLNFTKGIEDIGNDFDISNSMLGASTQDKGKKREKKNNDTRSGVAAKLSRELDDIHTAIENRNKDNLGCSIPEVIDMLRNIPGIERGSELFMAKLFLRKENRQMFVVLKDFDLQLNGLSK
ncbi:hypothetical protein FEM48_Zijuj04G0155100 [Ziziphus jujuba var. spinosa]|uniref:Uncharacterized protein n=1 Tax=Ziziphus jujuba var. spinosa TaxID=714518 RepID=A0A978VKP0_ZIZJJ|nr:hypothetical protein FEM48_Zijuj04G0155100 [Ziziphus jujuba var. spinosa]